LACAPGKALLIKAAHSLRFGHLCGDKIGYRRTGSVIDEQELLSTNRIGYQRTASQARYGAQHRVYTHSPTTRDTRKVCMCGRSESVHVCKCVWMHARTVGPYLQGHEEATWCCGGVFAFERLAVRHSNVMSGKEARQAAVNGKAVSLRRGQHKRTSARRTKRTKDTHTHTRARKGQQKRTHHRGTSASRRKCDNTKHAAIAGFCAVASVFWLTRPQSDN
jgi:hypothetical protein